MPDSDQEALEDLSRIQAESAAKEARIAEAVRIGVLTPEIRAMPDGGKHLFDKDTWDKLNNFALLRPANAKSRY